MENLKIKEKKTKQIFSARIFFLFILPSLSGVGMAFSFSPLASFLFSWISLIPLFATADYYKENPWRRFWSGYLSGMLFFSLSFWWIGYVTILGTAALVAYLSLYPALWLLALGRPIVQFSSYSSKTNLLNAINGANLWILLEWVRSWLFSGFSWNELGVSAYKSPLLLQICSLGGVLSLSWLLATINGLIFFLFRSLYRQLIAHSFYFPKLELLSLLLLLALCIFYGEHRLHTPSGQPAFKLRYAAIQPNIPQDLNITIDPEAGFLEEITLSRQSLGYFPDLICWPESPFGLDFFSSPKLLEPIRKLQQAQPFSFLSGSFKATGEELFNVAVLLKYPQEELELYAKNRLVPFGEFIPFANIFPFLRKLVPFQVDLTPGKTSNLFFLDNPKLKIAPLICFEDTIASYVRKMAVQKPDLLIDITNDGWFKDSPGAFLHMINALFRTVELDIPLLRCTNTGVSVWIDQRGRIINILKKDGKLVGCKGIMVGEAHWHQPDETLYKKFGDWIVALAFLTLSFSSFSKRRKVSLSPNNL
jgi:apolipoprotein N-acyltransferase